MSHSLALVSSLCVSSQGESQRVYDVLKDDIIALERVRATDKLKDDIEDATQLSQLSKQKGEKDAAAVLAHVSLTTNNTMSSITWTPEYEKPEHIVQLWQEL